MIYLAIIHICQRRKNHVWKVRLEIEKEGVIPKDHTPHIVKETQEDLSIINYQTLRREV